MSNDAMTADGSLVTKSSHFSRRRLVSRSAGSLLLLAILAILPLSGDEYWIKSVAFPTLVFGLAALGLNLVVGVAGQISMGQAAFMAIGAFVSAISYGRYGISLPLAILLAGLAGAMAGFIVGLPSLRIKSLYLMVSTLAAQVLIIWIIQRVPWFGATSHGTVGIPRVAFGGIEFVTTWQRYLLVLAVVGIFTIMARNILRSRIGRAWIAIRDGETAAGVLGVPAYRYKLLAFAVSGFYAGVAGALVVFSWTGTATVEEYNLDLSIKLLGMIIIGGLGSVLGSYLGAAFIALTPVGISIALHAGASLASAGQVNSAALANAERVIFGILILIFLINEPRGLARVLGSISTLATKRIQQKEKSHGTR